MHIQQTSEGFEFAVLYIQSGALQDIAFYLPGSESGAPAARNVAGIRPGCWQLEGFRGRDRTRQLPRPSLVLPDARVVSQVQLAFTARDDCDLWPLAVRARVPSVKQSGGLVAC